MGYLLLDRPNPNGDHFYPSRREDVLAIVVHVTAGAEDLDALDDNSAENVALYAATTDREVSWHTGSDTDSWVDLLPSSAVAWHATDYNGCTVGHEISKRSTDWRSMPAEWVDKTLRMAALGPDGQGGLRRKALELGVPFRWATKAELDQARAAGGAPVGFVTHAELQWEDRRDPGYVDENGHVVDTFPRDEFMRLLRQEQPDKEKVIDLTGFNGYAMQVVSGPIVPGKNGETDNIAVGTAWLFDQLNVVVDYFEDPNSLHVACERYGVPHFGVSGRFVKNRLNEARAAAARRA
ncbi:MAG: N-acetylmuramoyl-L-alanine amidase [Dermatophilaceae bacterium]|nr:N-acetylmuramoyl-L-alanine amidase [Dermatophilaceae bacterium]